MKKSAITLSLVFFVLNGFSQASPDFSINGQLLANTYFSGLNLQRDFVIDKYSHISIAMGFGFQYAQILYSQTI